jgi:hypothetical protein
MSGQLPPNPVGAKRPREFLCMECKPMEVGGLHLHLLLLLDAFSFAALGHRVVPVISTADYIGLLHEVGHGHDLHDDVTLLCDLPSDQLSVLHQAFPHLLDVRRDPIGVAAITDEARRYIMARFAALPKN